MNRYVVVVDGDAIEFETMEEAESYAFNMVNEINRDPINIECGVTRPLLVWSAEAYTQALEFDDEHRS